MTAAPVAVILAGGTGTRFWPASTASRPKQFLTLTGERSLLQLAFDRLQGLVSPERTLVVTAARFAPLVRQHLPELPAENVLGEPLRRDTAAAVALAGLVVARRFGPSTMCVLTADHLITPAAVFQEDLRAAMRACTPEHVVTLGIVPDAAATGFGYLEVVDAGAVAPVIQFREKPDQDTARRYVESGRFLWNSGMFVWNTDHLARALGTHLPHHREVLEPVVTRGDLSEETLARAFAALPSISVDKGVMEHLDSGVTLCVRARFDWSDVGSFPALGPYLNQDPTKNAARGRLKAVDARGNVVWCEDDGELVGLVGVSDLIVVRAGRRTLVAPLARAEDVKKLVEGLDPEDQ